MELEELNLLLNRTITQDGVDRPQFTGSDRKSGGVFAAIKTRLKWVLVIFGLTTLIFAPALLKSERNHFIFLVLYFIISVESIISLIALAQIHVIENQTRNVKAAIVRRIHSLKIIFRSYVFFNTLLYILFILFLEFGNGHLSFIYFKCFGKIPVSFRFALYLLFIIFQVVQKHKSFQKYYGQQLDAMLGILRQISEE